MMQTELLTLIFEEAKKQCESKNDSVGLGAMYSAIISVGRDSHVLEGKTYDIQEYEALRRAVARDEPEGTVMPPVKSEDSLTGQEKQLCAFRIWLNMSTRSAVDAYQYLRQQVKTARETGHPEKMTAGTERPIKAMTETEHRLRRAETEHLVKAVEKEHSVKKPTMEQLAAKTVQIREQLMQKVIGQDNIIAEFANGYFEGELSVFTEKNRCSPKAIFLFAGSPGVGKSYLATEAAKALELPVKRFDMSSYADDVSASELTGAGANFKSPKPGALTGFVHDHPSSMLIFDEIEKAHPKVINLFLQVLDAGTLYDNKYEANIAFGETVIIFTTNAGKSLYQDTTKHNYSDVPKKVILDALEKKCHPVTGRPVFPQAICSRLATGNVLLFNHLTAHQLSTIAARKLMEQQASLYQEASILSEDAESLATTLLFSLGGHCDARNMTAAAKRFFSAELFELYRLAGTDRKAMAAGGIQKIRWQLDIDRAEPIIRQLYHVPEDNTFLFFGSEEARMQAQQMQEKGRMLYASNLDEVKQILQEHELSFAAIDYFHGRSEKTSYLNAGDVHSEGRKCWEVLQQYEPELPVFIWETDNYQYNRRSTLISKDEDILHISF
ncbi:MAG: AAA family ATPase [Coprococcus sp.]